MYDNIQEQTKKKSDEHFYMKMKHQLMLALNKNEKYETELEQLQKELSDLRLVYTTTMEMATVIEEDLKNRIDVVDSDTIFTPTPVNNDTFLLKRKLAIEISKNEHFENENTRLKEEIEELRLLYSTIIEHATTLEDELNDKYEEVALASITDPLTAIYNRAGLNQHFKRLLRITENKFFLVMLDIDHFKKINDTYGHDIGDVVLKELVKVIKETIGKDNILARWGGEEFIILNPDADKESISEKTELLRTRIASHPFPEVRNVTCSFGVSQLKEGDNFDTIVKRADNGLYNAKNAGRNQVVII